MLRVVVLSFLPTEQAGEKLKGKVQINTVKPMKPCRMELFLVGKEKTKINKLVRNEDVDDTEEERVIISTSIPLHRIPSDCDISFRIAYTYPFEIELPSWLPSSMSGSNFGSKWQIQYKLFVCAYPHPHSGEGVVHNLGERYVDIISSPLGLRNISNRSINFPVSYQNSCPLSLLGGTFHKGYISCCMYIPNGEISKGGFGNYDEDDFDENIIMYVRLRNDSTCIIQHVHVEIQEHVKWFAKGIVTSSNRTVVQIKGLTEEQHVGSIQHCHGHVGIQQGIQPISTSRRGGRAAFIPMDYPNLSDAMEQLKERRPIQDRLQLPLPTPSSSKQIHYESYKGQLIHIQYYIVVTIITKNPLVNNVTFQIPITVGF